MLSVDEALARLTADVPRLAVEQVGIAEAVGRVLAEDLAARLTKPPTDVSAMDGYAARAADVAAVPATLRVVAELPAGVHDAGRIGPGEAARIFTGAPLPAGADTIVIQENTTAADGQVTVHETAALGRYVRKAGLDFAAGAVGLRAGLRLAPRHIALAAAMNRPWLRVYRRPRVAVLSTGDEIVGPGDPIGPNQVVSANALALAAFIRAEGGEPVDLGIAADRPEALHERAAQARGCDLLVTTGGASVGRHDLVQSALGAVGLAVDFWKIAVRPGKPLIHGRIGGIPMLGLPGNPVSSLVCALLFLRPLLAAMHGSATGRAATLPAILGTALGANDNREDYLRAALARDSAGRLVATPFPVQDSSMLAILAHSDGLVIRAPHAPALPAGAPVEVLPL
ncbi:MAG: molybdopterin molybdotransferase MoeA [Alphaproteobacteria bacterium]